MCSLRHWHGLLRVDNAKQLSDFMFYFNSNLAKEIGLRTGWKEKIWGRRYQAIVVSDEEEMQIARLRYVLSQDYASYCTSFRRDSSVSKESIWYMRLPGVTAAVRTLPAATHSSSFSFPM